MEINSDFDSNFIKRVASTEDADALNRLVNSAYRGDSSKRGWTTEADLLGGQRVDVEGLREMLAAPDKLILLFENKNTARIAACVALDFSRDATDGDESACYLGMLTVDPEMQAHGLGKKMMTYAESQTRSKGRGAIVISVIQLRTELIAWYERQGFKDLGKRKPFPYGDLRFGEPKRQDLHFRVFRKEILLQSSS